MRRIPHRAYRVRGDPSGRYNRFGRSVTRRLRRCLEGHARSVQSRSHRIRGGTRRVLARTCSTCFRERGAGHIIAVFGGGGRASSWGAEDRRALARVYGVLHAHLLSRRMARRWGCMGDDQRDFVAAARRRPQTQTVFRIPDRPTCGRRSLRPYAHALAANDQLRWRRVSGRPMAFAPRSRRKPPRMEEGRPCCWHHLATRAAAGKS
jgi:hypothetical protein